MPDDEDFDGPLDPVEKAISFAIREAARIQHESLEAQSSLMTVRQAAIYLATSTTTVRTLAKSGAIRSALIGEGLRFRRQWLDDWIDAGGGKIEPPARAEPVATTEAVRAVRVAARPRTHPAPKKPSGPVPAATTADGRALYLLRPAPPSRRGVAHYGFDARSPLCARVTDEPLKVVSVEAWSWLGRDNANCRLCLNEAGHVLGPHVVDLKLDGLTMRTTTRRGDSISVRNDGWHTGNGRTTWCGKTKDDWDLAFRSPGRNVRRCEECDERAIYLRQRGPHHDDATHVADPLFPRGVLLDLGVAANELVDLLRRAPDVFDVRRSRVSLQAPHVDEYDPFCEQYRAADQIIGTRRPVPRWCGLSIVVSPNLVSSEPRLVMAEADAVAWVRPLVTRAEHRKVLRAKWDREAKVRSR